MLLTSLQHRKIARTLRLKVEALPDDQKIKAKRMRCSADVHVGLARAQEVDPQLAPAAKVSKNTLPPPQPIKPVLVWVRP
jgi:hypothetical protein